MTETLTISDIEGDPFEPDTIIGLTVDPGEGEVLLSFWLNGRQCITPMDCQSAAALSYGLLQAALEADL